MFCKHFNCKSVLINWINTKTCCQIYRPCLPCNACYSDITSLYIKKDSVYQYNSLLVIFDYTSFLVRTPVKSCKFIKNGFCLRLPFFTALRLFYKTPNQDQIILSIIQLILHTSVKHWIYINNKLMHNFCHGICLKGKTMALVPPH